MGSNRVVGIILVLLSLTSMMRSSSAQVDNTCWDSLGTCLETAKAQNYAPTAVQPCCADLSDAVNNKLPCFCLIQADLISQGADAVAIFNGVLGTCNINGTMATICSAHCWENILPCLETAKSQNYAAAAVQPCCANITDAVNNDRQCFCLAQGDLASQGAGAEAIFNGVLGTCSVNGTMASICSAASSNSTKP